MDRRKEALNTIEKAFENKGMVIEDPEQGVVAGEDESLLDEIFMLNGVKWARLTRERIMNRAFRSQNQ